MTQTPKSKQADKGIHSNLNSKENGIALWFSHGLEAVFYQRESQVNFWTVLGGLAMAALLTRLDPLLQELQKNHWHLLLYLVASILVLANSWVQTAWGSLTLKWPISILTTVIMLFQMLFQSIQCLLITHPAGWFAATSGIIFAALVMQVYFEKSGSWIKSPPETIKRYRIVNLLYLVLLLISLAAAIQLALIPSLIAETIWGCVAFFLSIMALILEHDTMKEEKRKFNIP